MYFDTQPTYLEDRILSAGPLQLIQILYDAAIDRVRAVRILLREGDGGARARAVSKAQDVLSELMLSLNHREAKDQSATFSAIYSHLQRRLTDAHIQQSDSILAEIEETLMSISQNWQGVSELVRQGSRKVEESHMPQMMYGPGLGTVYTAEATVEGNAELGRSNRSWNL